MTFRTIATGLTFAAVLASGMVPAQQPAAPGTVARLTGVQGNVLVSQADSMATGTNEQRLAPGVRVLTTAGAKATVIYDKACNVNLGENRRYTVREQAECAEAHAPPLGSAASYGVLAGPRVANVGETVVSGDLGVYPGTSVTGFPSGKVIEGSIHPPPDKADKPDDAAKDAQKDAANAYDDLAGQRCNTKLTNQDLGGLQLTPGVYCFPNSAAKLTGELILDANGDPNAVFVFQVGTNLTAAAQSRVRVLNVGQQSDDPQQNPQDKDRKESTLCHVYWQVPGTVTIDRESRFLGNVFAVGDITVSSAVQMVGRAQTRSGAVFLDTDRIDRVICLVPIAYWPVAATAGAAAIGAGAVEINKKPKSPN